MTLNSLRLTMCFVATTACGGCSSSAQPSGVEQPAPPSAAAAPWVGCYDCRSVLTGIPTAGQPGSATFENGISVTASEDTLTAHIAELGDGGIGGGYACTLKANVAGPGRATLEGPPDTWSCAIVEDSWISGFQYQGGTITLDGGALTANLAVAYPLPGKSAADGGQIVLGTGTQVSTCTRHQTGDTCPWD